MTTFLESSACRGRQPSDYVGKQVHSRPDLITRLLRERHVPRFIVAPDGFGKSTVAFEYADIVFKFQHVFWINAQSPCFLRDLDADTVCSGVHEGDMAPCLLVFEDLPRFDDERAVAFSNLLDRLVALGDEVLITCRPSSDVFESLQRDRVLLNSRDLLLSDSELRSLPGENYLAKRDVSFVRIRDRIACMRWSEEGGALLAEGIHREEMPADMMLILLSMMLLKEGRVAEVEELVGASCHADVVEVLIEQYPYLGINVEEGSFDAVELEPEVLAAALKRDLDRLAKCSSAQDKDALASCLASALLARRKFQRAASIIAGFATKVGCGSWLVDEGWFYVVEAVPKPVFDVYSTLQRSTHRRRSALNVLAAWAATQLGDEANALNLSKRITSPTTCMEDRVFASLLLLRKGTSDARPRAESALREFSYSPEAQSPTWRRVAAVEGTQARYFDWRTAGLIAHSFARGPADGMKCWSELMRRFRDDPREDLGRDPTERAFLMCAMWLFEDLVEGKACLSSREQPDFWPDDEWKPVPMQHGIEAAEFICTCVTRRVERRESFGWFEVQAVVALESYAARHEDFARFVPEAFVMSRVRSLEVSLLGQRDAHRHAEDRREMERAERERTDPMSLASEVRAQRPNVQVAQMVPPILRVNLFGGMVITMGETPVSTSRLNRQKSKALLAVLILNHGREVSHERLAELLWPGSTPKSARKNFYSVWSNLRTTLAVKGFEGCPYLIRDTNGCRIDVRFVTSDVYEFDTLCRSLLFGRADTAKWETFFSRLCEEFSEELLPGERENELVCAVRARYSTQLVDALVAASTRLISENETQGALWFAREALRRDARREDVYAALMKAQLAAGQRSAAIGTYFQCRAYLAEELGIDPSMRLVDLYRKAIEEEEVFV